MPGWLDKGTSNSTPRVPQAPASPRISPPPSVKPVKPVDPARVRPNGLAIGAGAATPKAWDPVASANRAVSSVTKTLGRMSTPSQPAPAVDPTRVAAKPPPPPPTPAPAQETPAAPLADPDQYRRQWRTPPPADLAAPAAIEGNPTFNRYVRDPAHWITEKAYYPGWAAGAAWAAGKPLSYIPKTAPLGRALVQGGARLSAATAPYTASIIGAGGLRTALPRFPLAVAALPAIDGAFKLNQMLQDPAGGDARLQQSLQRYGNTSPAGYAANVGVDAATNALTLLSGDGQPLANMGEATIGAFGPKATVDGEYEAERGRELDAGLRSRQAAGDQATTNAMQSGTASQQQLRDALTRARQQQEAEVQRRNWRPWLWGMSQ